MKRIALLASSALVAACGGSQPPIGAPGATPQTRAIATHASHRGSWMLPEANSKLLYVSSPDSNVYVYSLPGGDYVGSLTGLQGPAGLCSDASGDVYVVDQSAQSVVEYAHGGQSPIKTLSDYGNSPSGCAVDPGNGNLAVAGGLHQFTVANLAIYADGQGTPTVYQAAPLFSLNYCAYDANGNVFASANANGTSGAIVELPRGSSELMDMSLNKNVGPGGPIQWDGRYVAVGSPKVSGHPYSGPNTVYQVAVSGSSGSVVKTIELSGGTGAKRNKNDGAAQFWIQGGEIVAPRAPNGPIDIWKYPTGGKATTSITVKAQPLYGVTVSVAPSR